MPEERRRTFDQVLQDSLDQWSKKFERALEQQRQVLGQEVEERAADIERATAAHIEQLKYAATEQSAELEHIAQAQRSAFEEWARARAAELDTVDASRTDAVVQAATDALHELEERAGAEAGRFEEEAAVARENMRRTAAMEATAFDEFARKRLVELEDTARQKLEALHADLIDDARRARDTTLDELGQTRAVVTSERRQFEAQAAATRDELQRAAAHETATFDDLARRRVEELQHALREQTELLDEFTRVHRSASSQLEGLRSFTAGARDRLAELEGAAARHTEKMTATAAASAEEVKQLSTTEVQRIEQRTTAFGQLAGKRYADLDRLSEEIAEFEGSTAERVRELDRHMQSRRAEVHSFVDDRIAALTDHVRRAEAVTQRVAELDARAEATAHALDVPLAQVAGQKAEFEESTAEWARQLERHMQSRRAEVESLVDDRIAALVQHVRRAEAVVERIAELEPRAEATARTLDERFAQAAEQRVHDAAPPFAAPTPELENKLRAAGQEQRRELEVAAAEIKSDLLEWLARAEASLTQVGGRVEGLEAVAGTLRDGIDGLQQDIAALQDHDEDEPVATAPEPPEPPEIPARVTPPRDSGRSTPDLRWD